MGYDSMIDLVRGRRTTRVLLALLTMLALGLGACSASDEVKQGARGEYCNKVDTDCREGLVCVNSVCTLSNPLISEACQRSCTKITACGLDDFNCANECAETLKNWSASVIEEFATCISDELGCDQLGASDNDAAQICYDRLEVDPLRLMRCRDFKAGLQACQSEASLDITAFENRCMRMARTTDEETWARTDACAQVDVCAEGVDCVRTVFGM